MARNNNLTDFLKDVADAIREKTNEAGLINPQDFPERIGAIETTGGQPEGTYTVRFIDVDGRILKTQYVADGGSATPPANPTREKCEFVKWLNAYENITKNMDVFALYKSADGNSWYRVKANANERMNLSIKCDTTSPVTIDWGDGATDTATKQNVYTVFRHDYAVAFDGWVKVSSEGGYQLSTADEGNPTVTEVIVGDKVFKLASVAREMVNLTAIVIPETVTLYNGRMFRHCVSLSALVLPDGVTTITNEIASFMTRLKYVRLPGTLTDMPADMLAYCSSLQSVDIPSGITSIGNSAFDNCHNLRNITIPEGVTSIGENAFRLCFSLREVNIPEGITSIKNSTFQDCRCLQSITIPHNVTSIGNSVFKTCRSLQNINIPESVTSIGESAFMDCSSLRSISIPEGVTKIGSRAFCGCTNAVLSVNLNNFAPTAAMFQYCRRLTGAINLQRADVIPYDSFANTSITSLYAKTLKITRTIGGGAFNNCSELVRVELPDVTDLSMFAFQNCQALTLVIIGEDVSNIGNATFQYNSALERLVVKAATPPTLASNSLQGCSALAGIYVPDASVEAYKTATNWSAFADIIKPLSEFVE